jgi:DNA-binding NtrC family response regulator
MATDAGRQVAAIDDDADWLATVALALRRIGLADPLLVQELPQAWELLAQARPRLVLIDLLMPRCTPLAILHRLRGLLPESRIVIVSGQTDTELAAEARLAGADAYLAKCSPRPLTDRLQAEWEAVDGDEAGAASGKAFARMARLPALQEVSDQLMHEALVRTHGNQAAAARLLGVTPQAINQRLKRQAAG